ncbi:MAG: UDP-glucose/GDP-mannose dehydrogenase family protein [Alphaproteobacteria bacterium]|nr:UDP-glucose/GDP-mannose dehydrogenase family protein [Alphaproteobacteria bacterium]
MKITIIGTGYVGLVSGTCFAELGFDVTCVDKDENKIQKLKKSTLPFFEPNLSELLDKNVREGRLHFTSLLKNTAETSKIIIIAVGTPCDFETGRTSLKDIYSVLDSLAPYLRNNKLLVLKSTVPIGTLKKIEQYIYMLNKQAKFELASNPEFLREGNAIQDFMKLDRIVVGTESLKAKSLLRILYHNFLLEGIPYIETTPETAELIKYASNAFLGLKVSYINQMADLCEKSNGNIRELAQALGLDHRIGRGFLDPGPGFGGSCLPKDLLELSIYAKEVEKPLTLIDEVLKFNNLRPQKMLKIIQTAFEGNLKGKTIAILGLTFKANTDDLRDSPSLNIINKLYNLGATLQVYDPKGMESAQKILPGLYFAKNPYEAMKNADGLVILTEWEEFKDLDLERVKQFLKTPLVIDLRNIFSLDQMKSKEFTYYSLGHRPLNEKTKPKRQAAA